MPGGSSGGDMAAPGLPEDVFDALVADHPVTIGKALSKKERIAKGLKGDSTLVYGEIEFEAYARTFEKIKEKYGGLANPGGIFVDFGSGTGKAVFAAALLHTFDRCIGVEILSNLHKAALELLDAWQTKADEIRLPAASQGVAVEFHEGDACDTNAFDASTVTFGFANSTCFDDRLMERVAAVANGMPDGALFVTFTKRLPSIHWEILDKQRMVMSWGDATVFIHRKRPPFVQQEEDDDQGGGGDEGGVGGEGVAAR